MSGLGMEQPDRVMRQYTRGLRIPALIGKLSGGWRIPGGPYTTVQFVGGASVVVMGASMSKHWARFDVPVNIALGLLVPLAVVFVLGLIKPGGRGPLSMLGGVVVVLTRPSGGSHQGRALRLHAPRRLRQRLLVQVPVAPHVVEQLPAAQTSAAPQTANRAPAQAAGGLVVGPVVLTGVQRLLATTAAARSVDPAAGDGSASAATSPRSLTAGVPA